MSFHAITPPLTAKTAPFADESNYEIKIYKQKSGMGLFVQGFSERIILESFRGTYGDSIKETFTAMAVDRTNEFSELREIFGETFSEEQLQKDAYGPYVGDLLTGYALIDKVSKKIIGRLAFISGGSQEEAICNLYIGEKYRGQGYGKEALLLGVSFALALCTHGTKSYNSSILVKQFTVMASEEKTIAWLVKWGWTKRKNEDSYVIETKDLVEKINAKFDINRLKWSLIPYSTSPILHRKSPVNNGSSPTTSK